MFYALRITLQFGVSKHDWVCRNPTRRRALGGHIARVSQLGNRESAGLA